MILNLSDGDAAYKRHTIIHEFGHALGLGHEHQSPYAPKLDREAVIKYFMDTCRWEREKAEEMYDRDYPTLNHGEATQFDPNSIMQYW